MTSKTYQMEAFSCPNCSAKIDTMLKKTAGVQEADVHFESAIVRVTFDEAIISAEDIKKKIGKFGYAVLSEE